MMNMIYSVLLVATVGFTHLAQAVPTMGTMSIGTNTIVGANATYEIVDVVWNVLINNTGTPYNITATGTVQDALAKMALFDPARAAAINQSVLSNNTTTTTTKSTSAIDPSAEPHEAYVSSTRYCNIPGGHTSGWRVKQGIEYLGTVAGTPTEGPGPGACGRVSCSYGAAIYWCNDNLETKVLSSFLAIADGAQLVLDYCVQPNSGSVSGQQFYTDGWNVMVTYNSC